MAITYYLQPNPITPDPNDQSARIVTGKVLDAESITKLMLRRGTTVTESDILAVLKIFFEVVSDEVADGNNVNLPLVNIRPSISGVFNSVTDSFDGARHIKKASLSSGILLTKKMADATVEKTTQLVTAPALIQFLDINTQNTNSIITPNGIGQLVGEELKFNPDNIAEGIYFVASDGTANKVTIIASRTEGKLMFSIPALASGNYTLEVRKGYGTTNVVVRTGSLQDSLQVS